MVAPLPRKAARAGESGETKGSINGTIPTAYWNPCKSVRPKKAAVCAAFAKPSDGLEPSMPSLPWRWPPLKLELGTASAVQASSFRRDVAVFRLDAACAGDSGPEPAFRRNEAAHAYTIEAAPNPEVAGSNPAPATDEGPGNRAFGLVRMGRTRWLRPASVTKHLAENAPIQAASSNPSRRFRRSSGKRVMSRTDGVNHR
jgi:hypothetical protein